jgi:predicted AAA+ superfamily ATPase
MGTETSAKWGIACKSRYSIGMSAPDYVPRLAEARLERLFAELPALSLVGPRATGKTTIARRHARSVARLDDPVEAGAFRDDPDVALRALPEPVLLDEWQAVPDVLGAVKRAVDSGSGAGRFLLTGSVRAPFIGKPWPGTGRIVDVRMYGLTEREIAGRLTGEPFLSRLAGADVEAFPMPADPPDLLGYVELALRGGFPDVLRLSTDARRAWLDGYLNQLLTRDVEGLDGGRDPHRLRLYFEALALSTAGLAHSKTLYDAAQIDHKTALAYQRLLTNLLVLDVLPAWTSNRLSRMTRTGKRHLVDTSLVAAALELDEMAVLRDGDLLGRMIDTFVLAQIRPEAALSSFRPRLYHLRARDGGHEIDLIAELSAGNVVAVEIKSSAAPKRGDAKHLEWLRDRLGERFLAGAVLHTGPRPFRLSERIFALPIATLWG